MFVAVDYCLAILAAPESPDGAATISYLQPPVGRQKFEDLLGASEVVREVVHGGLVAYAEQAIANYRSFTQEVARLVEKTGEVNANVYFRDVWERAGASAVLSVAAAVHLFQEQTEAAAERKTGGGQQVHELFRRQYDASPGHYFIYRLRNLMAHQSMKFVHLDLDASSGALEPKMRVDMTKVLNANAVNAAVAAHLSSDVRTDPDLGPLFDEAIVSMRQVFREALPLAVPEADNARALLRDVEPRFRRFEGTWALAEMPSDMKDGDRLNFHLLTRDLFKYAAREDSDA